MSEEQIIAKLKTLKKINPNPEWVILTKKEILGNDFVGTKNVVSGLTYKEVFSGIFSLFTQRKFAYTIALFLFMISGIFGIFSFIPYNKENLADQSMASLTNIKSDVNILKEKSQNLAEATKNKSENVSLTVNEIKTTVKKITNAIQKNPELAKVVALDINNNKTLLDISGGNDAVEVVDMYKILVMQLLKDFDEVTLNLDQNNELDRIRTSLNNGGDSITALRDILLMNASVDINK